MKILLIEDDLDLGNGVRIALADQGFDVIWVRRKEDALHQLDACVPELILLDLGLPDGDGMGLMTCLRQQFKGIPVIREARYRIACVGWMPVQTITLLNLLFLPSYWPG